MDSIDDHGDGDGDDDYHYCPQHARTRALTRASLNPAVKVIALTETDELDSPNGNNEINTKGLKERNSLYQRIKLNLTPNVTKRMARRGLDRFITLLPRANQPQAQVNKYWTKLNYPTIGSTLQLIRNDKDYTKKSNEMLDLDYDLDEIVAEILSKQAVRAPVAKEHETPILSLLLGRSESLRKSARLLFKSGPESVEISDYSLAQYLPNYQPDRDHAYRLATVEIAASLLQCAIKQRHHLEITTNGVMPALMAKIGRNCVEIGYSLHVLQVQSSLNLALGHAYNLWRATGRFVPEEELTDSRLDSEPAQCFQVLKPYADSYCQVDADADYAIIDQGGAGLFA